MRACVRACVRVCKVCVGCIRLARQTLFHFLSHRGDAVPLSETMCAEVKLALHSTIMSVILNCESWMHARTGM